MTPQQPGHVRTGSSSSALSGNPTIGPNLEPTANGKSNYHGSNDS